MDTPPQFSFSGRWHSSMTNNSIVRHSFTTSSPSPAPRNASTFNSSRSSIGLYPVASDISARMPSVTSNYSSTYSAMENSDAGNKIAPRKGSTWDALVKSGARASASGIAARRASLLGSLENDSPTRWHRSMSENINMMTSNISRAPHAWKAPTPGPLPTNEGSTWDWMFEEFAVTCGTSFAPPNRNAGNSDRNRVFYAGNINDIFNSYNDKSLAMADIEAIMYVHGVDNTSAQDVVRKIDPNRRGMFEVNSFNKQIFLDSTITFSSIMKPSSILRHASKCFQDKLLSTLHFSAYIFEVLKERYLGFEPEFTPLGMDSILGVLQGSSNELTSKDVDAFTSIWNIPNQIHKFIITQINDNYNGTISRMNFYLLYRLNLLATKHLKQQYPSIFFKLIDKDQDGFLSSSDIRSFAAIFHRFPTNEAIDCVTRKLDMDGDGKISLDDFLEAMAPILDGITWEFWLVAILFTFEL